MKKKLAYFGVKFYPSRGGVSRVTENIIRSLKDEFDITIYCFKNSNAENYIPGVKTIQFKEPKIKEWGVFVFLLKCYFHMMKHGEYDLVHIHKIDSSFFIPLLALKYKNILVTSHESPYLRDKWSLFAKLYFKMNEKIFIHSGAKLTVISNPLSEYYKNKYSRDVMYIPNGVEKLSGLKINEAEKLIESNHIKKPFIVYAARRIMSTKGCHTMLKALKHINFKKDIVIMGELTHSKEYTRELKILSQDLNSHFLGYIGDKKLLMSVINGAKYFTFPSEVEGMSIMLLEVASLGIPIIASDIPENKAVFNDNELLFFKNRNHLDLANKIEFAENNSDYMKEMAKNAQTRVRTEYSVERMVENYKNLYYSFDDKYV